MVCCSKEASYDDVATDPSTQQPADDQGDTNPSIVSGEVLDSFGVTFEGQTKVLVDLGTGTTAIEDKDEALVFVNGSKYATYIYDESKSAFVLKSGETPIALTAAASVYYPANEFEVSGENVLFVMPGGIVASGDLGAIAPMAGVIAESAGDYSVELKNLASILRVQVTADVNITNVVLNFGDSNRYAEGAKFTVDAEASALTFSEASLSSGVIVSVTPATTADVLFLLPTVALPDGLEVTANLASNHNGNAPMFTIKNASTAAPTRNTIKTMSFYAGLFSGGAGTEENPYKISSVRDFRNLITYSTNGYTEGEGVAASAINSAYYQQTADIDFKGVKMAPIGDSDHQFTGQYDGNDKQLQNVNISETGAFAGIFAYVNGSASIKDLTVSGSITKTGSTDNSCVGGIAGIVRGAATVTGCTNNTTITSSATYTGGIAGRLYQSTSSTAISGCTNNGSVTSSVSYTGGIVGQQIHGGTIVECVNKGTVSGTSYVGGIVGDMGAASATPSAISFISFCRNDATINASANCSGGIAGRIINGSVVSSCFAKGTVSSESYDVGGIAGLVQVNNSNANSRVCVYDCLTAMNVTTTRSGSENEARTGGAVGFVSNNQAQYIAIDNCGVIATSVTVGGGTKVGGFVGRFASSNTNKNRTRIRNCYTLVSSISSPNSLYGGFVGNAESYGELHYCYYVADDSNVIINNNTTKDNLTKKTAVEIASNTTCETFNANNYVLTIGSNNYGSSLGWNIPAGCDYPVPGSLSGKSVEYYK
ncbi:MAG: hypothetical protein II891_04815 [Bacteroidales bacterium]|nr:hypothetical protein [Bacteroidales bacterium]